MNFDMVDRSWAPEGFACIWQRKRQSRIETEKMWIHFSSDVFVAVRRRSTLNSQFFTKAWSMQAWILVESSNLYFWESVSRVDSIFKWGVYIKLKVSLLPALICCMSRTRRDREDYRRRVRTHKKNSRDTALRLGAMIQSIFVPNQEPVFAWPFGNGPVRVGRQGPFPRAWKLSSCLFSRPDWLPPWVSEDALSRSLKKTRNPCNKKKMPFKLGAPIDVIFVGAEGPVFLNFAGVNNAIPQKFSNKWVHDLRTQEDFITRNNCPAREQYYFLPYIIYLIVLSYFLFTLPVSTPQGKNWVLSFLVPFMEYTNGILQFLAGLLLMKNLRHDNREECNITKL